MWPLRDINPTKRRPVVTQCLIMINAICFIPVFWAWVTEDEELYMYIILTYGFTPSKFLALDLSSIPTLFTSMFVHADPLHIFGNMLYLHIFGDNVEDTLGRVRYIAFYFLSGFGAIVLHIVSSIFLGGLNIPVVGASGAISGLMGAYLVFFPKAKILTAVMGYYFYRIIPIRAEYYIGFWFIYQLLWATLAPLLSPFEPSSVAYWAHVGGFLAGLVVAFIAKRYLASERFYTKPYW